MSNLTEKELADRARAGETDAFWRLVEDSAPLVYRVLLRLVKDSDRASDILNQTFLKAYDKIGDFRGDAKISSWFVSIAINLARNEFRRDNSRREISWDEVAPTEAEHHHGATLPRWRDPHQVYEDKEMRELLDRALEELPPIYQAVFTLRDIEGLSTSETANALGISETAVKSRAVRARLALRNFLTPYFSESVAPAASSLRQARDTHD